MTEEPSKPFYAKCGQCSHIWPAAYYPVDLTTFAKITKSAACPKCGERKRVFIAKQEDGILQEPAS